MLYSFRISGTHLSDELTGEQLADMKAYLNLTEMVLSNAELYITWAGIFFLIVLTYKIVVAPSLNRLMKGNTITPQILLNRSRMIAFDLELFL